MSDHVYSPAEYSEEVRQSHQDGFVPTQLPSEATSPFGVTPSDNSVRVTSKFAPGRDEGLAKYPASSTLVPAVPETALRCEECRIRGIPVFLYVCSLS